MAMHSKKMRKSRHIPLAEYVLNSSKTYIPPCPRKQAYYPVVLQIHVHKLHIHVDVPDMRVLI